MVNRVLIRLKVVQMLYGYMLSRSEFKVETPTQTSSPDRRYSYKAYSELLLLLLILSGHKVTANRQTPATVSGALAGARFAETTVAGFLAGNDDVREIIREYASRMPAYDDAIVELATKIKTTSAYRTLTKIKPKDATPSDEIAFWTSTVRAMVKLPSVVEVMRTDDGFTVRGMETGAKMLIETLNNYSDTRNLLVSCKNDLNRSLNSAYALYHWIMWLPVVITRAENERLRANAAKFLPTEEDLHPDRRFVDSEYVDIIAHNPGMEKYLRNNQIGWEDDIILVQRLLNLVLESEPYKEFMAKEGEKTIGEQADLWRKLLKNIILPSEDIAEAMESNNIFWNDDLEVMSSFALKTLRQLASNPEVELLPEFKDEEDANFGKKLFESVVAHREEYRKLIDEFVNSKKWDAERIAMMDVVILETAVAEALDFPNIPLSVTANEYVEIANWYSTSHSGSFINGMFAAITDKLRSEGRIFKKFN